MGINRAEETPASPDLASGKAIGSQLSRIAAVAAMGAAAVSSLALLAYSNVQNSNAYTQKQAEISALIAPDLAWREVRRIEHAFSAKAEGGALALDAEGRILAGDDRLIGGDRTPVTHNGELVGYVILPKQSFLPLWLFLGAGVFCVLLTGAAIKRLTSSVSNSVSVELTELREALEKARADAKLEKRKLRSAAFSDPITGLPNRNRLRREIRHYLPNMTDALPGAYVQLDLDGYVRASSSFGVGGDQKIVRAAIERIQSVLEDFESAGLRTSLSSLQSDKFGLFLAQCVGGRETVSAIVRRLNSAFEAPLAVDQRLITLGISAGITMLPEDGTTPNEIFRRAEMSLEQARNTARNGFQFYAPSFDRVRRGRYQLEDELRNAAKNGEFVPVFQPKIDLQTGEIRGAEALARWYRDEGKVVMPGTFIEVAEEIGLIDEIGRQILAASCEAAAEWASQGFDVPVAVNVSPRQFEQEDFCETVTKILSATGLPPHLLELEITESMAIDDPQKVTEVMGPLREMGVRLAIDDFGTGHSNLATLTQLPFDVFKIDRQFVSALQKDHQAPAIVEMILAMSETLGLKTVAEGVETEEQAHFLRKRGCALGQGFLYSPGIPLDQFIAMLDEQRGSDLGKGHQQSA